MEYPIGHIGRFQWPNTTSPFIQIEILLELHFETRDSLSLAVRMEADGCEHSEFSESGPQGAALTMGTHKNWSHHLNSWDLDFMKIPTVGSRGMDHFFEEGQGFVQMYLVKFW
jgi:hypothetical protein